MRWESKGKKRVYSIKRLVYSFKNAFNGIISCYKTEQNILIHTIIGILVIVLGFLFKISKVEFLVILITIGVVFSLELINTSIEYCVDLAMPNIHPLAKSAKDIASGAVLFFSIIAILIGLVIFIPYVKMLFK